MESFKIPLTFNDYRFDFFIHDPNVDRIVSRKILKRGVWESTITQIWMDHIFPGDLVLDIGANIGWYSKIAALKNAEVISFEPDPRNFEVLKKNCYDATTINAAVGASSEDLFIKYDTTGNFGDTRIDISGPIAVKQVTLDEIIKDRSHEIRAIKIDVQGWEPYVIAGGKETFSNLTENCLVLLEFCPYLLLQNNFNMDCLDDFFSNFKSSFAYIKDARVTLEEMMGWLEKRKFDPRCHYGDTVNFK